MAEDPNNRGFTTVYEDEDAGTVAFERREEIEAEVISYLDVVKQLKADFKTDPQIQEGLHELEMQLNALRISQESEKHIRGKLSTLIKVPVAPGKTLRLDAFRKTTGHQKPLDDKDYRERVQKMVRNTTSNITHLLLSYPSDSILHQFQKDIAEVEFSGDIRQLKYSMEKISKSPQLWHYNEKKKSFLLEWLRPFQEYFGKPIEELTEEEIREGVKKVEEIREKNLEDMTGLTLQNDRSFFRSYNHSMHHIMNGKSPDFWGGSETRDEFLELMQKLIIRFTLNLEERFLIFTSKDEQFAYLVGFSDDAFDKAVELEDGRLGIYPHMKVFLNNGEGKYSEITKDSYPRNPAAYYRALKTAVVPFLVSISVMLESDLSDQIKGAFDMWV